MTNYVTKRIQIIFRCVFKGILAYLVSGPKSTRDFPGLLLVFVEIMPDKAISDHKKSHLVYLKILIFCDFFMEDFLWPIYAKFPRDIIVFYELTIS